MQTPTLYPLRFAPHYLEKIWGGNRLQTVLDRDVPHAGHWGESWDLSGLAERPSVVTNGPFRGQTLPALIERYGKAITGQDELDEFPVLIKMLDAELDLSIQVHPDDALALKRHGGGKGKSEMWCILAAEPGARLITGFKEGVDEATYLKALESGKILDVLNEVPVQPGEVYYVPAGRIHTIGGGILLAEIQQSSDYTYRIYDWDRKDPAGNLRELHTEAALEALDYQETGPGKCEVNFDGQGIAPVVQSPHFTTLLRKLAGASNYHHERPNTFTCYTIVQGQGTIRYQGLVEDVKRGEVVLFPADMEPWELSGSTDFLWLETHL